MAAAVGLTWWGANNACYSYGYDEYYNPYYSEESVVDYSEPVMTAPAEAVSAAPAAENLDLFDQARVAFYDKNYQDALKLIDQAAVKLPHDAVLHEFRSLVLFALKRYQESAAAIHAVLAVGPGWDWKTLSSLYPDIDTYAQQLRALEVYRDANPNAADARFLLGYHYLTCGAGEARVEFQRASELLPDDTVTASLVRSLTPRDAAGTSSSAESAPTPEATPVPADDLVGTWVATGTGTAKYSMSLDKEGAFTWNFSRGARKEEVKGVYTVEGNILAMEPDSGGVMLAELALGGRENLRFKMVGGPKDDPGLNFKRGR